MAGAGEYSCLGQRQGKAKGNLSQRLSINPSILVIPAEKTENVA